MTMRSFIYTLLLSLLTTLAGAQAPQAFNY